MNGRLTDELINISTMLMLAKERGEVIQAASTLNSVVMQVMDLEKRTGGVLTGREKQRAISASIKFTKDEVKAMSKTFKKEFIANGCVAHITKRPSGKKGVYYEIRYRRNGYNITVSNKDLKTAKQRFVEACSRLEDYAVNKEQPLTLAAVTAQYFKWKKGKVLDSVIKRHVAYFEKHIPSTLKSKRITAILPYEVNEFMNGLESRPRLYEEVRSILNQVFKFALASGYTTRNPISLTAFKPAVRQCRPALTEEQIHDFFAKVQTEPFAQIRQMCYCMYFFGLRPCEVDEELKVDGNFIVARNRKRKKGRIEYKRIPIHPVAKKYINFDEPLTCEFAVSTRARYMKKLFGENTAYSLRHTFSTLCQKTARPDIVDIWLGDSPERLVGRFYTHFDDDFMYNQMLQVNFIDG